MKTISLYLTIGISLLACSFLTPLHAQIITTIAGTGALGYYGDDGPATAAKMSNGVDYTISDSMGNIYISDAGNFRVRMVNTVGIINVFAGTSTSGYSGDGLAATLAQIRSPRGLAADNSGNLYIADEDNYCVRRVDHSGIITTVAGTGAAGFSGDGGPATLAKFGYVYGIATDHAGNLYIADAGNNRIRKVSPATGGIVTTIAGNGVSVYTDGVPATATGLNGPLDVAVDGIGNVYIAENNNNRIRKVDTSGVITTIAGTGISGSTGDGLPATAAELSNPSGVAIDGCGNIYIADTATCIRKVDINGIITTVAGNKTLGYGGDGGPATASTLSYAYGVKTDRFGNVFISDVGNRRVRKITNINRAPYFTAGHIQGLIVCSDSSSVINSLLAVIDSDTNQGETWSILSAPMHGTLTAAYTTISTGGTLTPAGLSYIPGGYIGSDSFKVVISDCADLSDTTTVYVTAKACPLSVLNAANAPGSLEIYPNPNSGTFSLYISSATTVEAHIVISNLMGEKVKEINAATNTVTDIQLTVPEGIYFCNVITKDGNYMEKVLIFK